MGIVFKKRISMLCLVDFIDINAIKSSMINFCSLSNENPKLFGCSVFSSNLENITNEQEMRKFYEDFLNFSNKNHNKNIICFIENSWLKNNYDIELFNEFRDLLIINFDHVILIYGQDSDKRYKKRLLKFNFPKYEVVSDSSRDIFEKVLIEYSKTLDNYLL